MKILCLIFMLVPTGHDVALVEAEKPFESLSMCEAWKHQQEFQPPVRPSVATSMACIKFWEA